MPSMKINPYTQIRWSESEYTVSGSGDFPLSVLPQHHQTHESGGDDAVHLAISQVDGLQAQLDSIPNYVRADADATVTGTFTFTTTPVFEGGIEVSDIYVDVIHFNPIYRPDDLSVGEMYRDITDNKLYLMTDTGPKAFVLMGYAPPVPDRIKTALVRSMVAGNPHQALANANAYIFIIQGLAHTQAYIKVRNSGVGQARARAMGTYFRPANAKARIKRYDNNGYGQATVYVDDGRRYVAGYATGWINNPVFPNLSPAHVRARIKSYNLKVSAQALAIITV